MDSRKSRAEENKELLIAAVIRLLDRRSVADVSVKDIAAEAGVNHGLVHRHFGSKDALVREAVVRTHEAVNRFTPPRDRARWFLELLAERPEIARILARCCLDGPRDLLPLAGPPPAILESFAGGLRRLAETFLPGAALDPYLINAVGTAAALGWVVFRPLLEEGGFRVPANADEQLKAMATAIDQMIGDLGGGGPTRGV